MNEYKFFCLPFPHSCMYIGSSFLSLVPQVKIPRAAVECFLVSQSQWLINFDHLYILSVSQSHNLTIFLGQICKIL